HSYSVIDNSGAHDDQDVTFTEVAIDDPTSMWNSGELIPRTVSKNGVDYTLYYIKIREGGGADQSALRGQPTNVDAVLAAYEGRFLKRATSQDSISTPGIGVGDLLHRVFEINQFPSSFLPLESTIPAWGEIF